MYVWRSPHHYCALMFIVCILLSSFTHWLGIRFISFLLSPPFIWNHQNYSTAKCRSSTIIPRISVYFNCTFFGAFQWFPAVALFVSRHKFICGEFLMFIPFCSFPFHFRWISSWCDNETEKEWNRRRKMRRKLNWEQKKKKRLEITWTWVLMEKNLIFICIFYPILIFYQPSFQAVHLSFESWHLTIFSF